MCGGVKLRNAQERVQNDAEVAAPPDFCVELVEQRVAARQRDGRVVLEGVEGAGLNDLVVQQVRELPVPVEEQHVKVCQAQQGDIRAARGGKEGGGIVYRVCK